MERYLTKTRYLLSLLKETLPAMHRPLAFLLCLLFCNNLLNLSLPWILRIVIDNALLNRNYRMLHMAGITLISIYLLNYGLFFLRARSTMRIGEKLALRIRKKLLEHIQSLSAGFFDHVSNGDIVSRLSGDVDVIKSFFLNSFLNGIFGILQIAIILCILFFWDWSLTIVSLLVLPSFVVVIARFEGKLQKKYRELRQRRGEVISFLQEILSGIKTIKAYQGEKRENIHFMTHLRNMFQSSLSANMLGTGLHVSAEFIASAGSIILLWYGGHQVIHGSLSIGKLMGFYTYLGMIFLPLTKLVLINNQRQETLASLDRIMDLFHAKAEETAHRTGIAPDRFKGTILFDRVSFGYRRDMAVLKNISFHIEEGEHVAIVGHSGAGKSTLAHVLVRFYPVTSGRVTVDGYNITDINLRHYRSRVGVVLQDDFLYNRSIRDNITYPRKNVHDHCIKEVARFADADGFIMNQPDGYDTIVGERGIRLSRGQRQKISIARALLADPDILILDEATSSLDTGSQAAIYATLSNVRSGKTTIWITHRISSIIDCHRIITLDGGRIAEIGKHNTLMNNMSTYYSLYLGIGQAESQVVR